MASEELAHPVACWGHQGRRKGAAAAYAEGGAVVGLAAYDAVGLLVAVGLLAAAEAAEEDAVDRGVAAAMGRPSEEVQSNQGLQGLH